MDLRLRFEVIGVLVTILLASLVYSFAKPLLNTYSCAGTKWAQYSAARVADPANRRFMAIEYAMMKRSCANSLFEVNHFVVPPKEVIELSNDPEIIKIAGEQLAKQ